MSLNVTITLDEETVRRARVAAAQSGKSLSRFAGDLIRKEVGAPTMTQLEALEKFLAGPPLNLVDENGMAPSRDDIYAERVRIR
jgi:hypothetical protein